MASGWSFRAMAALPWDLKSSDSGVVALGPPVPAAAAAAPAPAPAPASLAVGVAGRPSVALLAPLVLAVDFPFSFS